MTLGDTIAKKEKAFHLAIESAILVPRTDKSQNHVSIPDFKRRIRETDTFLARLYGGFTKYKVGGGYYSKNLNKVIYEDIVRVVAFTDKQTYDAKYKELMVWIHAKKTQWGQEAIGYEIEGDLLYI